jgi:hypothetical protein
MIPGPGNSPVPEHSVSHRRLLVAAWFLLFCSLSSGAVAWIFEDDLQGTLGYLLAGVSFATGVAAVVLGSMSLRRTIRAERRTDDRWASILVIAGGLLASLPWVALALWVTYLIVFKKLN